uniref:uncharacterized protein LOC118154812 n=1 Tax=Callithrix jacchus TaxID=9483 RepID=UPI00159E311A|nr:uncharacterized protein LOC118154812 [Callithrix jacchus]
MGTLIRQTLPQEHRGPLTSLMSNPDTALLWPQHICPVQSAIARIERKEDPREGSRLAQAAAARYFPANQGRGWSAPPIQLAPAVMPLLLLEAIPENIIAELKTHCIIQKEVEN